MPVKNRTPVEVNRLIILLFVLSLQGCVNGNIHPQSNDSTKIIAQNSVIAAKSTGILPKIIPHQIMLTLLRDTAELDLCEGLVTNKNAVSVPRINKPAFASAFKDPAFGARVIRISDTKNGEVVKPQYSTIQSWNADESRLLLYHTGGLDSDNGHHLYDGETYQHQGKLDIDAKDIEEVYWHTTNPEILFYISAYFKYSGQFIRYNITTGKKEVLAQFDSFCGQDEYPVSGNDVQMPALGDDLFGFRCTDGNGLWTGFSFQVSTGGIRSIILGDGSNYEPWYAPSPTASGKYYRLNGDILESDLKTVRYSMDMVEFHSHSSLGRLANGNDALFATAYDWAPEFCDGEAAKRVGSLVVIDIEEKTCNVVVGNFNGYGYPGSGTHVSAVAYKKPGWVLMSTIGYGQFEFHSNSMPAPILFSEIYLVNTDTKNQKVCRVAHHRSYGKQAENTQYNSYMGEPHATISPSGTRIVFGSDWYNSGSVDTYVVELPVH